ncbi:cell division protein ZapA [Defluviitalea saccharophila]|uniref:Cell division protein ZapA n=1 Tax=Defluviitalea saccharophila TaxID=879970 RepID=A0ABZ2Y6I9_9FIRM|nr:cell division protein ZapA [Candidatus Epulonipiscium sp.]
MGEKNKIEVIIGGRVYTLVGEESQEYIQRVALYIDRKMSEVRKADSSRKLSTSMIAILTSINVADDLFKMKEALKDAAAEIESLQKQLDEKDKQIEVYQNELGNMQQENLALKDKIDEIQLEIMRSKMELEEYINIFDANLKNKSLSDDH